MTIADKTAESPYALGSDSPFLMVTRHDWAKLQDTALLTLSEQELEPLCGQDEHVSLSEVVDIYMPLTQLLHVYITASQDLYGLTSSFLTQNALKTPYLIGLAGSVAVGKSTTARLLQALLSRWPYHRKVALVTTDGFLWPNRLLEERGLMQRKGFPESYNLDALKQFVSDLKAGRSQLRIPVYSHHIYDIVPDLSQVIDQPDIVIIEGLNILQTGKNPGGNRPHVFISDYFDFTIYVDARISLIRQWYIDRFLTFYRKAQQDTSSFFSRFAQLTESEARLHASRIWKTINEVNLRENILPTRERARLILKKGAGHSVQSVYLRKL